MLTSWNNGKSIAPEEVNFLQDMHESGEIEPRHLPGEDTCADALTKPLDKKRFVRLREYLMNSRVAGNAAAG